MAESTERTIYFNEDNHHFYGKHPSEDMSEAGIQALVDKYVENSQVAGILFCVNVQRALFDSAVWETFWDDYDPALGEDQPALRRTHGIENHLLLRERGLDQHAIWLDRCRHHGIEGWLTMRMNDCHGLKETYLAMEQISGHQGEGDWATQWATRFWKERPDLRRAPYRLERSWEGAFDYGKAEVREHHLKLIEELFERYDMDGLELDWMRWGMMFAPGQEYEGRAILTDFIRQVRKLADACEERVGHPIRLAHRLPAHPESCLALGYDPITWAREGLADMVTLSSFLGNANFDLPIEIWRAMLGDKVKLLAHVEENACPVPEHRVTEYELLYGAAASALNRGVDGVYLFNQNYREFNDPDLLTHMLCHIGSEDTLSCCARRHAVTYPQVNAPGGPCRTLLPIPLRVPQIGADFGRMEENISLRINCGKKPQTGRAVLALGFQGATDLPEEVETRLNTVMIRPCSAPDYQSVGKIFTGSPDHGWKEDFIDEMRFFALPDEILHDGDNLIELLPPAIDGELVWAEILHLP